MNHVLIESISALESGRKFVSLVFSAIVSEPQAVATGSCDTLENVRCSSQMRLDPVATARGSDTSRHRGVRAADSRDLRISHVTGLYNFTWN